MNLPVDKGSSHPLGATLHKDGVNFSILSGNATAVDLLLFQNHDDAEPFQVIEFDPYVNKTFHFWHVFVHRLCPGIQYAFRMDGPSAASAGHRYNRNKVLIDPDARENTRNLWNRSDACGPQDNVRHRCVRL